MKAANAPREVRQVRVVRSEGSRRAVAVVATESAPQPRSFLVHTLPLRSRKVKR